MGEQSGLTGFAEVVAKYECDDRNHRCLHEVDRVSTDAVLGGDFGQAADGEKCEREADGRRVNQHDGSCDPGAVEIRACLNLEDIVAGVPRLPFCFRELAAEYRGNGTRRLGFALLRASLS